MYKIKYYDNYIDIPGSETFTVLEPKLVRETNKVDKLTFTMFNDHPLFGELKKLKYGFTVKDGDKIIFKGRIIDSEQYFDNSIAFTIEGKLAALNDSPCRAYEFKGTPADLFKYFIENHNAQVSEEQKFKIGKITVTDSNDYISRSWEHTDNTLNLIKSRLLDTLGGYLIVRYESDGDYIDYLENITLFSRQNVEFGENLLELSMFIDAASTYTACVPYGAKDDDGKRIDIRTVNDGKDYIINEQLSKEYGVIYAPAETTTWDDVTIPNNLLKKAKSWLYSEGITFNSSMELTFLDLSRLGLDISKIDINQNVYVISKPHNLEEAFLVDKMETMLHEPEDLKVTIGKSLASLTDRTLGTKRETNKIFENISRFEQSKPFLHIRYSPVQNPTAEQMTAEPNENTMYTGMCHSSSGNAPADPKEYTWQRTGGADGEDAVTLRIDSSRGTVFKNNQCETILSAVIYKGSERITNTVDLERVFGQSAYLEWKWQRMGETTFGTILSTDERIGDGGFTFKLTPADVDTKVVFMCQLVTN